MTTVMYASFFVVMANALVDIVYILLDPRVQDVPDARRCAISRSPSAPSRAWCAPSTAFPSTSPRARSSAWSANRARARRSSLLAVMGLINDPNAVIEGSITFRGRELVGLPPREMRKLRGREIAMIFQDPMTALTPVYTIGWQIAEQIMAHEKIGKARRAPRAVELLAEVNIPNPARSGRPLSASAVGRHAPARGDRHGAVLQSRAADRRRADHGARRHRAGADPRPHPQAAARSTARRSSSSPTTWA